MSAAMGRGSREPRRLVNPDVIEAFAAGVRKFGAAKIARALRKSDSQLYGEMNPNSYQTKGKLSVDDAFEATKLTGDTTWLAMIAEALGYHLISRVAEPDKQTVPEELVDDTRKLGRFAEVVTDPNSTPKEIREASADLRRDITETETLAIRQRQQARSKRLT